MNQILQIVFSLAGVSIILMVLGYSFVREDPSMDLEADKFERRKKS